MSLLDQSFESDTRTEPSGSAWNPAGTPSFVMFLGSYESPAVRGIGKMRSRPKSGAAT